MRSHKYTAPLAFAALTLQLGVTSAHGFGGSVRAGIVRNTLENRQGGGGGGTYGTVSCLHFTLPNVYASVPVEVGILGGGAPKPLSPPLAGGPRGATELTAPYSLDYTITCNQFHLLLEILPLSTQRPAGVACRGNALLLQNVHYTDSAYVENIHGS
ncbi:hypothetical protein BD779DRAFT_1476370 [Infundibulicybe gibba]|nr:hypothetical protein BD779DRAFT_1476370 [Infundibulicybe gibba]